VVVQSRDSLLRQLLGEWMRRDPHVAAVVLAADGAELSRLCEVCHPDAVVVDAAPDDETEALLERLRAVVGRAVVVLLVERGGVRLRPMSRDDAVQPVLRANCLRALTEALGHLSEGADIVITTDAPAGPLTGRELDVLRLLSLGRRSPEIGSILGVSARTVENHKRRIFAKLDVHGETQAVAEAIRLGLLRGAPPLRGPTRLTPRESEIINLAAAGRSVKQTARALNISVKTVESIQSHLFSKLGVSGRTGAVAAVFGRDGVASTPGT
jgi:DNA-binding NarL/FixJ family response regulator